jgi:cytochrome c biogenesis protein CcmG, thiol:disulfide interchange protein DsbE
LGKRDFQVIAVLDPRRDRGGRYRDEIQSDSVSRTSVDEHGGVAIAVGFGLLRHLTPSGVAFAGDLRKGGRLEELRLPQLEGDGSVEYAAYADRPLVINFFASWWPNCIAEMPEFERVHAVLGDRVSFLGISQSDARGASIALAKETGITYETAIDERGEVFNAIGGLGMPTTVFVRPGGEIAEVWVGALDAESLRALVAEHLGVA